MEVLFHEAYSISLDNEELMRLAGLPQEGKILYAKDTSPYNPDSGKKLVLMVESSQTQKIKQKFFPEDADWDGLERVIITLNEKAYDELYFQGFVYSESPETPNNILIQG